MKKKITAIIIDDMPRAIDILKRDLVEFCPEVEITGTADSVVSGAKLLKKVKPDILFLDIQLGDGTGFDLLEILQETPFKLIFTTASDEHAIRAFRFAAIDYLLKPIDTESLIEAVNRAKTTISSTKENLDVLTETFRQPDAIPRRISLHTMEKIVVVEIKDIIRCESDNNNTIFHLSSGKKIFVTKTLKQFERLLEKHNFLRIHQSHLINVDQIREYVRTEGGYLKMKNGDIVPVSVRKKAMIVELLG